jgi:hypothetical protein
MKTSTILLISAIVIIMISLTAYNFTLRASYLNGDYKNPYYGLAFNPVKKISNLHVGSANNFQLRIIQGEKQGLYVSERANGRFTYKLIKDKMLIDLTEDAKKDDFMIYEDDLILVLSKLDTLDLAPYYKTKEEQGRYLSGRINIKGFIQEEMVLNIGPGSIVSMDSLKVGKLKAVIGNEGDGRSELSVHQGIYQSAVFEIPGAGSLELLNPEITKSEYSLSKNASVTLNGKALKNMR